MMTTQITKPDFTGQHLFSGVDVGKRAWKVCILTQHLEHKTFTQPPKPEVLVSYLHRHFPGAQYHYAYEAGARYSRQLQPLKNRLNWHCSWRFDSLEHKSKKELNGEVQNAVLVLMDF